VFLGPEHSEGCATVVALNVARRGRDVFDINPFVGVRHSAIEDLVTRAGAGQAGWYASVARPLFELTNGGQYRAWEITGWSIDEDATKLVEDVVRFGWPWAHRLTDIETLLDAMYQWNRPDLAPYRIAAALFLLGDCDGLNAYVQEQQTPLPDDMPLGEFVDAVRALS